MTAATDPYGEWDAAYVLGALSPEERREFERHLGECLACTAAVAELAGVPGLLATVPPEVALHLRGEAGAPVESADAVSAAPVATGAVLPRLLEAARRRQRRTRALIAGLVVAASGVAASLALLIPAWLGSLSAPVDPDRLPMDSVVPSPLTADVRLAGQPWGTRIDSHCIYEPAPGDTGERAYALFATDEAGNSTLVATWRAGPGSDTWPSGTTSVPPEEIQSVDIRLLDTGQVLLRRTLDG